MAASGPPSHHGMASSSSQVKRVRPRPRRRRVKRPLPVTSPVWRTPIVRPSRHSVTSMRSTSLNGPTFVSHSKVVPTPRRRDEVNRIASASAIHSTCEARSCTSSHTVRRGAGIVVDTLIRGTARGYDDAMAAPTLDDVRRICLALPEAEEVFVDAWGHPTFRVRNKMFASMGGEGAEASCTFKTDPDERDALDAQGEPYFVPAYVGHRGWRGLRLGDRRVTVDELAELLETSWRMTAPKRVVKAFDDASG